MLERYYKFTIFFLLMCIFVVSASAFDILAKIGLEDAKELSAFAPESYSIRFVGKSFLLIQVDEDKFNELSIPYSLLDKITPNTLYYLIRSTKFDEFGDIIFEFGESLLVRIKPEDEPRLISTGLQIAPLPENVRLYSKNVVTAPRAILPDKTTFDYSVITDVIDAVSIDEIKKTITELQENHDLDPPYSPYKSRYCLRVRQTDDPSDDACDNAADYIFNKFKSYGLDVEYDQFPHEVLTQGHYQMRNVVATLPGKGLNSNQVFVITSHYDSIATRDTNWMLNWKTFPAPGADDNASGTATVLEAARILSQYDFNYTIKFITFSGEELGLHGSKHYANMAFENKDDILGVINLDMIAYDPDIPDIDIVSNAGSEWLVEAMMSVQRSHNIGSPLLNKIVNSEIWYSDHSPFWNNGYHALLAIDNHKFDSPEFYPFMHTEKDTIDKLNFDLATNMIKIATGTIASLADPVGSFPHPDLAISEDDINLSYEDINGRKNVQVKALIHNVGKADAEDTLMQVWVLEPFASEPQLVSEEVVDVNANKTAQISASFEATEWGDYNFIVKTNPDYRVFETNGGNNTAAKNIKVGSANLSFGKLMLYPNPFDSGAEKVNIAYSLSKDASIRIEIYDISGRLVHQESFSRYEPGGRFGPNVGIEWDGTNLAGEVVASGIYFCYVIAVDDRDIVKNLSRKIVVIK